MFAEWLDTQKSASWDQLLKALRGPNVQLMYLANEIEQMLNDENEEYGKEIIKG